ncbi:hypothetical protein Bbelb_001790 [Branchiostoma belcheri]|nr:hypothetical protein Bbelb_001790 [Branchiostoma belcheri]
MDARCTVPVKWGHLDPTLECGVTWKNRCLVVAPNCHFTGGVLTYDSGPEERGQPKRSRRLHGKITFMVPPPPTSASSGRIEPDLVPGGATGDQSPSPILPPGNQTLIGEHVPSHCTIDVTR